MKRSMFAVLTGITFFVSSCEYKNAETKFPPPPADPCDSISYKKHIKPIIDVSCETNNRLCHASNSLNDFSTYDSTSRHLPKFQNKIFEDKVAPMPPATSKPLTDEELREFKCWLDAGYKNN